MKFPGASAKLSAAILAGVMFFIISNPMMYKFVDGVIGGALGPIASPSGCPTTWGLVVHSSLFAVATYYGVGL